MMLFEELIAMAQNGHKSKGYYCECGVIFSNRSPTADHVTHLRKLVEATK